MVSVSHPLTQELEQQQLIMMKKLLLAVCRDYLEKDQLTLLSTSTKELVTEARETYPTFNDFKNKLYWVIDQLNKREKYFPIAKQLMTKMSQIYGEVTEDSEASSHLIESEENSINVSLNENIDLGEIIQAFKENENSQRIHKMLFALSQRRWENNLEILSNYPIDQLIPDICQAYPNLERVSLNLLRIVKGLNKQGIYSNVAKTIITELAKLYQENKEIEKFKSLVNVSKQTLIQSQNTHSTIISSTKVETETRKHNFNYNPYQVRQRIMKYTNPLKAKMLLFYALYANEISSQQDINILLLKTYELDQMVIELVQKFRTIQELQNSLETTALSISSMNHQTFNTNEKLQVIKSIIMSVKPLYETT